LKMLMYIHHNFTNKLLIKIYILRIIVLKNGFKKRIYFILAGTYYTQTFLLSRKF